MKMNGTKHEETERNRDKSKYNLLPTVFHFDYFSEMRKKNEALWNFNSVSLSLFSLKRSFLFYEFLVRMMNTFTGKKKLALFSRYGASKGKFWYAYIKIAFESATVSSSKKHITFDSEFIWAGGCGLIVVNFIITWALCSIYHQPNVCFQTI